MVDEDLGVFDVKVKFFYCDILILNICWNFMIVIKSDIVFIVYSVYELFMELIYVWYVLY